MCGSLSLYARWFLIATPTQGVATFLFCLHSPFVTKAFSRRESQAGDRSLLDEEVWRRVSLKDVAAPRLHPLPHPRLQFNQDG